MKYVNVAIDVPLARQFIYRISDELFSKAMPGMRVLVPFRNRERIGYIISLVYEKPQIDRLKDVIALPDLEPIFSKTLLSLLQWMSGYYLAPIGEVCACSLPNTLNSPKDINKQHKFRELTYDFNAHYKSEKIVLTREQENVLKELDKKISVNDFSTNLIHGVTGSGKTEIYLRLIETALKKKKQIIVLVPEISLIPQMAGRLVSYFNQDIAIYNSSLTEIQKLHQWKKMHDKEVCIVVGTRSALFAPFDNLGLIIVDEEHDNSYKQDESPRYNARDAAIMRGKFENVPIVMGSATPCIESLHNTSIGKYNYFKLTQRHGNIKMPDLKVVDMRKEIKSGLLNPHLSIELITEITKEIRKGHQTILFLNRRGYSNFVLCKECGYIPECPNCAISLTFHKRSSKLNCHYCGYNIRNIDVCPKCKGYEVEPIGSGTEMIEEAIKAYLPKTIIARLDKDTTTSETKRRQILADMQHGKIDILIGTQMVTKGHDFPNVTLVGIISADQALSFPDFRSEERTYQLLTQVSGRAGRSLHPGKVIIQTFNPESMAIKYASQSNLKGFLAKELLSRKDLMYPPFSRIANIRMTGNLENNVREASKKMAKVLSHLSPKYGITILGPSPAPLCNLKGKTRWQIMLKAPSVKGLAEMLASLNKYCDTTYVKGVQISIDVDPVSTM